VKIAMVDFDFTEGVNFEKLHLYVLNKTYIPMKMTEFRLPLVSLIFCAALGSCTSPETGSEEAVGLDASIDPAHFDKKGKAPSAFTTARWEDLQNTLPFEDKRDFEEQKKGFIAAPTYN